MRRAQLRVGEAAHGALGDPGPPEQPSAADAVRPARIGFGGYITCTLEPWSVMGSVGRISTWPESVEMNKRSVACKCFMHKCSVAKSRRLLSDEQLMTWLFTATPPPIGTTLAELTRLGEEHVAEFKRMLSSSA